jgi:hypothetical protein
MLAGTAVALDQLASNSVWLLHFFEAGVVLSLNTLQPEMPLVRRAEIGVAQAWLVASNRPSQSVGRLFRLLRQR